MVRKIIGGVVALVIGGSTYAVSNSNIISNFSKNTGMSQQQAQQYVNNIPQSDLESFSKLGQDLVTDGNSIINAQSSIDCVNYTYQWQTPTLNCSDGKYQLLTIGNDEVTLGGCYQALGTDLGDSAQSKINDCISDIDTVNSNYSLPIAATLLDSNTISDNTKTNAYNKSVLESALQSN